MSLPPSHGNRQNPCRWTLNPGAIGVFEYGLIGTKTECLRALGLRGGKKDVELTARLSSKNEVIDHFLENGQEGGQTSTKNSGNRGKSGPEAIDKEERVAISSDDPGINFFDPKGDR